MRHVIAKTILRLPEYLKIQEDEGTTLIPIKHVVKFKDSPDWGAVMITLITGEIVRIEGTSVQTIIEDNTFPMEPL